MLPRALRRFSYRPFGVDELDFALPPGACFLIGQDPDIGGNAGVVKDVIGQSDDGFQQIIFQNVAADLGGAAAGVRR